MDPRFSTDQPAAAAGVPSLLLPGQSQQLPAHTHLEPAAALHHPPAAEAEGRLTPQRGALMQNPSFESASADSDFTSISQRAVNPEWQAEQGYATAQGGVPYRGHGVQAGQQRRDGLAGNPDFELPGAGGAGAGAARGGADMGRGTVYRGML